MSIKEIYKKRRAEKLARKEAEKLAYKQRKQNELVENLKKTTRKPEEIQKEYDVQISVAGEKNYRVEVLKQEVSQHNQKIFELNKEYQQSKSVWSEPKAPAQPDAPAAAQQDSPKEETPNEANNQAA